MKITIPTLKGAISPGLDRHGNPLFCAWSAWTLEEVTFYTRNAAEFWLWLVHEREAARAFRGART